MANPRERKFSIFDVGRKSSLNTEMESLAKQMTNLEVSLGDAYNNNNMEGEGDIVMIGVDGSRAADEAITWYLENLHRKDNMLILVYAVEIPASVSRDGWESQIQVGKKKQEELQERYVSKFKELGINGEFLSEMEKPGELIINAARKKAVTYIVMASRGFTRSRKTPVGTVADFVIHNAECPVVMART